MKPYSDLAIDSIEAAEESEQEGIEKSSELSGEITVNKVKIISDGAAERLSKPKGEYYTIEGLKLHSAAINSKEAAEAVKKCIAAICNLNSIKTAMVVGLGNRNITPDALGPLAVENILVTRHITAEMAQQLGLPELTAVSAMAIGVMGQTGIETADSLKAMCDFVKPDIVFVIDCLAASTPSRLATTIQISNAGISPGSGVKNTRARIDAEVLGREVIAIGVPLVADISAVAEISAAQQLIITPREIDILLEHSAQIVACGINMALQQALSYEEILQLI